MWVKICGIRDEKTAAEILPLKPDAIGLNFYAKSPRVVQPEIATRISELVGGRIERVGLFVNHPNSEIEVIANVCQLDAIQLHGDELPDQIAALNQLLPDARILRAWRSVDGKLSDLKQYLDECHRQNAKIHGCLVDAHVSGSYGGTGQSVPWDVLTAEYQAHTWPPLILAGGLNPQNVHQAIEVVRPWGVDVASGVESTKAVKDMTLVREFIANARRSVQNKD